MRRELRRWRRKGGGGERCREERKKHKDICTEKTKKETERWEKIKETRTEEQI